ncbi:MAG: hypothetical protein Q8R78_04180, partial [Candidatus Omnitrophota bacterium]|nr:hypothetical protein [Candidatus Omnitrophota bacterium]
MKGYRYSFHLAKASAFAVVLLGFAFGVDAEPNFEYRQITDSLGLSVQSVGHAISSDGRFIAFHSKANLTGGNLDGNYEIFLFDAVTEQLTQVTSTTGSEVASFSPTMTADGMKIAFMSLGDLVPGGNPDGLWEIFLFDQLSGLQQLTVTPSPKQSLAPSISADGTKVVFYSDDDGNNLDPLGSNPDGLNEVFLFDMGSGTFQQLTDSANYTSINPQISGDGSRVVFLSDSPVFGPNPEVNLELVRVDLGVSPLFFVPVTHMPMCPDFSNPPFSTPCTLHSPVINFDGTRVVFISNADLQYTVGNTDASYELFLWDQTPTPGDPDIRQLTALNIGPSSPSRGVQGAWLNGDGTKIVLASEGDFDSAIGNADANFEIFLYDDDIDDFIQVTQTTLGTFQSNISPAISADGRVMMFTSDRDLDPLVGNSDANRELFLALPPPTLTLRDPDVNDDGEVSLFIDIFGVAARFGASADDPCNTDPAYCYDPRADLNADGGINLFNDIFGVAAGFGTSAWPPVNSATTRLQWELNTSLTFYLTAPAEGALGGLPTLGGSCASPCPFPPTVTSDTVVVAGQSLRRGQVAWTATSAGDYDLVFVAQYPDGLLIQKSLYVRVGSSGAAGFDLNMLASVADLSPALPVLAPIGNKTVVVSGKLAFTVSAADPQPDDALTLTATLEDGRALSALG